MNNIEEKKKNNLVFIVEIYNDKESDNNHEVKIFRQFKDANNFVLNNIKKKKDLRTLQDEIDFHQDEIWCLRIGYDASHTKFCWLIEIINNFTDENLDS